jgi:histidinol-phosphate aminotransferase
MSLGITPFTIPSSISEEEICHYLQSCLPEGRFINLGHNENALGASPLVHEALAQTPLALHAYPAEHYFELRQAIARHLGLQSANILLGHGSSEALQTIASCYLYPGDEMIVSDPTWGALHTIGAHCQAQVVSVPNKNNVTNLEGFLGAITPRTRLMVICNPSTPTGTYVDQDRLASFVSRLPEHVTLVVDEAYGDYVESCDCPGMLSFIADHRVIVTRTFSKIYGLAALRIGYAVGKPTTIAELQRHKLPYSISVPALMAARVALSDQAFVDRSRQYVQQERALIRDELMRVGFTVPNSEANFLFVETPFPAQQFADRLLSYGIWVRVVGPNALRISIGLHEHNQQVVNILQDMLSQ